MDYEYIAELFNFTNVKALKQFFSDTTQQASSLTKAANSSFTKKEYDRAKKLYKEALPLWNETIRTVKDIPETNVGPFSLSNWVIWAPFVQIAYMIVLSIESMAASSVTPGTARYVNEKLADKLNEAMQTKSISKHAMLQSYIIIQDFVEDRIKLCDKPSKTHFEAFINEMNLNMQMEGYLTMIEEGLEGLPWLDGRESFNNVSESTNIISEYINSYV